MLTARARARARAIRLLPEGHNDEHARARVHSFPRARLPKPAAFGGRGLSQLEEELWKSAAALSSEN